MSTAHHKVHPVHHIRYCLTVSDVVTLEPWDTVTVNVDNDPNTGSDPDKLSDSSPLLHYTHQSSNDFTACDFYLIL